MATSGTPIRVYSRVYNWVYVAPNATATPGVTTPVTVATYGVRIGINPSPLRAQVTVTANTPTIHTTASPTPSLANVTIAGYDATPIPTGFAATTGVAVATYPVAAVPSSTALLTLNVLVTAQAPSLQSVTPVTAQAANVGVVAYLPAQNVFVTAPRVNATAAGFAGRISTLWSAGVSAVTVTAPQPIVSIGFTAQQPDVAVAAIPAGVNGSVIAIPIATPTIQVSGYFAVSGSAQFGQPLIANVAVSGRQPSVTVHLTTSLVNVAVAGRLPGISVVAQPAQSVVVRGYQPGVSFTPGVADVSVVAYGSTPSIGLPLPLVDVAMVGVTASQPVVSIRPVAPITNVAVSGRLVTSSVSPIFVVGIANVQVQGLVARPHVTTFAAVAVAVESGAFDPALVIASTRLPIAVVVSAFTPMGSAGFSPAPAPTWAIGFNPSIHVTVVPRTANVAVNAITTRSPFRARVFVFGHQAGANTMFVHVTPRTATAQAYAFSPVAAERYYYGRMNMESIVEPALY